MLEELEERERLEKLWMLEELERLHGVQACVVLSSDGLVTVHSDSITRDDADGVAAGCSSLIGGALGVQASAGIGGRLELNMTKYAGGFLFITAAGNHSRLAVVTTPEVDVNLIGRALTERVVQIGSALNVPVRG
jgi:predicted regulator of Ras-like GTPase activity (Roadblock/LC7/MglB family)